MQRQWMRNCDVALIVYSLTDRESFDGAKNLLGRLDEYGSNCQLKMLVATKLDLEEERKVSRAEGYALAQDRDMLFIEVSTKSGYNLDSLVHTLSGEIHKRGIARDTSRGIDLEKVTKASPSARGCCSNTI